MREGWTYKKLGEVCFYPKERIALSEISANQYVGVETLVKDRGGVSFGDSLPSADFAIKFIKDDVLIGNIRPYLKKYGCQIGMVEQVVISLSLEFPLTIKIA